MNDFDQKGIAEGFEKFCREWQSATRHRFGSPFQSIEAGVKEAFAEFLEKNKAEIIQAIAEKQ
jgi:hypothetical protein